MKTLVLLRHGESQWNKENRFTGWVDVPLSAQGEAEAKSAGQLMQAEGFVFDIAFTSVLKRAIKTLWVALEQMDLMWIPVKNSWRLNERMYGGLTALNKAETAARHGDAQVKIWRRSYDIPPPPISVDDPNWPGRDPRYQQLDPKDVPLTECLKDTVARFLPYWESDIAPTIRQRPARADCGSRQQLARPGQAPGPDQRPGHPGAQHPHRHPAGLRAQRRPHSSQAEPLSGRSGSRASGSGGSGQAGRYPGLSGPRAPHPLPFSAPSRKRRTARSEALATQEVTTDPGTGRFGTISISRLS